MLLYNGEAITENKLKMYRPCHHGHDGTEQQIDDNDAHPMKFDDGRRSRATNKKSTTRFPMSLRWSSYVAPKSSKGGL